MPTVRDIVERLTRESVTLTDTVDGPQTGSDAVVVTGIATAFMPTVAVLEACRAQRLNLLIAHEGAFFAHRNQGGLVAEDPVARAKRRLAEEAGVVIWRWHDHMHRVTPDPVVEGLLRDLGWSGQVAEEAPRARLPLATRPVVLPPTPLRAIVEHVKARLGLETLRLAGDPEVRIRRVGVLPGYTGGGATAIPYFREDRLDLIVTGEGPEWETPEYVRDAVALGFTKALLVLGHGASESSGMKYLAEQLAAWFPDVPARYLPNEPVLRTV
jgi:putative NIF3 family GTP cyclohydrolase 1 type 2